MQHLVEAWQNYQKYIKSSLCAVIKKDWFYLFLQQYKLLLGIEKESQENIVVFC